MLAISGTDRFLTVWITFPDQGFCAAFISATPLKLLMFAGLSLLSSLRIRLAVVFPTVNWSFPRLSSVLLCYHRKLPLSAAILTSTKRMDFGHPLDLDLITSSVVTFNLFPLIPIHVNRLRLLYWLCNCSL